MKSRQFQYFGTTLLGLIFIAFLVSGIACMDPTQQTKRGEGVVNPKSHPSDLVDVRQRVADAILRHKELARPSNGVSLKCSLTTHGSGAEESFGFNWEIAYSGIRRPLVILGPTLTEDTPCKTRLVFRFYRLDGSTTQIQISQPQFTYIGFPPPTPKSAFLIQSNDKPLAGRITVKATDLYTLFQKETGRNIDDAVFAGVFATLYHSPSDRGQLYNLDAWTGEVQSELIAVYASRIKA